MWIGKKKNLWLIEICFDLLNGEYNIVFILWGFVFYGCYK